MVKEYLIALKEKGNFSWSDLSKISGLPDATIRKKFSGETSDPRFETVVKLVTSMGGSLNEILNDGTPAGAELYTFTVIKELYETRIAELKESADMHISSLQKDKKLLIYIACILGIILIAFLLFDLLLGSVGWIRY